MPDPARERSAIQPRTARHLPLLLLLAAACAGAYVAWRPAHVEDADPAATVSREATSGKVPAPPVELKGRPDAKTPAVEAPSDSNGVKEPVVPSRPSAVEAALAALLRAEGLLEKQEKPRFPARPGRPDIDLGDPYRAPRHGRLDLLGRRVDGVGPWIPDGRGLVFTGMAHVDHEDAGDAVEEEIEEPLVTAVVGRVLSGGAPLAGAEVILYSTFYQRHARYDHHVREVGRALTDGDGGFDLRPIGLDTVHFGSNGEVLLTVHREGYGSIVARRLDNIEPEIENDLGTFDLETRAATLVGTVRDLAGEPVPGATVRVSGSVNPVLYDKTERMIILKDCPTAVADEEGLYRLQGFAVGTQHVSVHVNIDCVEHFVAKYTAGEHRYDPRVQAGNSIRGRVVDTDGEPIAAAVVSGGNNWTPSNADGTFWLDNIRAGPLTLQVAHHLYAATYVENVSLETEDLEVVMAAHLPRVELFVTAEESDTAVPLIAIDWQWANGRPPHPFVPVSRYWHAADGRYAVVVPEGAIGARVSAEARGTVVLDPSALEDGRVTEVALPKPE